MAEPVAMPNRAWVMKNPVREPMNPQKILGKQSKQRHKYYIK